MNRDHHKDIEYNNQFKQTKEKLCYNFGEIKFKPPVQPSQFWVILVATLRTIRSYI